MPEAKADQSKPAKQAFGGAAGGGAAGDEGGGGDMAPGTPPTGEVWRAEEGEGDEGGAATGAGAGAGAGDESTTTLPGERRPT